MLTRFGRCDAAKAINGFLCVGFFFTPLLAGDFNDLAVRVGRGAVTAGQPAIDAYTYKSNLYARIEK